MGKSIARWIEDLRKHTKPECSIILVGNKSDLKVQRKVPLEDAKLFARRHDISFVETSALESTNVPACFNSLLTEIFPSLSQRSLQEGVGVFSRPGLSKGIHVKQEEKKEIEWKCCNRL